jgi:hypothetical protein
VSASHSCFQFSSGSDQINKKALVFETGDSQFSIMVGRVINKHFDAHATPAGAAIAGRR